MDTNATSIFHAPDIECEHCTEVIDDALGRLDGIGDLVVDVNACTVTVDYDQNRVSAASIRAALEEAGYPTSP